MCCFAYKWAYKFLRFACLIRPEAKKQCFFVMFFSDLFFKEGNMANLFSKQSFWCKRSAAIGTILFVSAMFAACSDEVTEVTEVVGMQVVEAGDALPKCTADNEGAMVYSVDSAAAYYCVNRNWTSMKGKDGVDGKDGKDGADGKNGKDGKNGTSESSSCTAKALKNGKGYKIVCGGDSVGVVLNGEDGVKGDSGVAGTSCSAEEDSDGVKITCTDGKSFTLSNGADGSDGKNCEIVSDLNGAITLACGEDTTMLYKAMCGTKPYDPAKQICDTRDMQLYRVVTIGEQIWMAENLNYKVESSFCYNDSAKYCEKYGRLYQRAVAISACPEGWHLPDSTEWRVLFDAVGGQNVAGKILKASSGWIKFHDVNGNGSDDFGFSALPAGSRASGSVDGGPVFFDEGSITTFWSSQVWIIDLITAHDKAYYGDALGSNAYFSVRCLENSN
jgi:uncharacterized protein (TIGR02145 family)